MEELTSARLADQASKTPIPERVWALRNVAGAHMLRVMRFGVGHTCLEEQVVRASHNASSACQLSVLCGTGTLAMGGPNERGRARKLLEQAVLLKGQYAGRPDHPGDHAG